VRFLHSSDWHLGRTVRGQSRASEHEAALQQVLHHARDQQVDCVLVGGDVFDTSAPSPESEAIVYNFFRELYGLGIAAVVIAGNHDHPKRLDAVALLLDSLRIHTRGVPQGPAGALIEVPSRDGKEKALVATLPWVNERDAVDFDRLPMEQGAPLQQYAERITRILDSLARGFRPDTVNVMLAHLLVDDSVVGIGGGERELHMSMGIYGVRREALPVAAQYTALGHVHRPQTLRPSPPVAYSGSLLQLDFGERDQQKYVNLVEVHPRLPAEVTQLPITAGRQMVDVGTPFEGVTLNELAQYRDHAETSWLRVYVDIETPVPSLAQLVRAELPSAVHVERSRKGEESLTALAAARQSLGPEELFGRFYESKLGRSHAPAPETMALFRRLLEEERDATAEA
jgi:exonuclease SbcD